MPYQGDNGKTIVHFNYHKVLEWVGDSEAAQEAKTKLDAAKVNRSWDELHSLAKRHSSSHSPGRDVMEVTLGMRLPYTQPIIVIPDDSLLSDQPTSEMYVPSTSHDSSSSNTLLGRIIEGELAYPFDELMLDNRLPIPGPIATSSQLPKNPLTNTSLVPTLPANVEDLIGEVFGNCSRETSMSLFQDSCIAVPWQDHL